MTKLWGFIRLIRPEIILLAIACVYVGALVAGSGLFSMKLLVGIVAVLCIGAGCHPLNDYFDYDIDRIVHPNRPLPAGVFKRRTALYLTLILFVLSIALSSLISILCLTLNLLGIGLVFLYELSLKNKGVSGNMLVAFTAALSFNYGGAVAGDLLRPSFLTLIAFLIFLGREIIMDVRDYEGDRHTRATLPTHIGKPKAVYLGSALIILAVPLVFLIPFLYRTFTIWFDLLAVPLAFLTLYTVSLSVADIQKVRTTAELLRIVMILGLIILLIGIFL